jgi:hypothetical protein
MLALETSPAGICYADGMAREESDREDLLREATALVQRIELAPGDNAATGHIVIGFRQNGAVSFYFGADPVYQFNVAGALRRAFCDGQLIKASQGRLISLKRERSPGATRLSSRELSDEEHRVLIARMRDQLRQLATELGAGRYRVVGQVPAGADLVGNIRTWLAEHDGGAIVNSPRVGA